MATQTYPLFCMGNPLLDMQVTNGEELLTKYDLKANDAILAEEKHLPMWVHVIKSQQTCVYRGSSYGELVKNHKLVYVAGGAAQNAARGAAVCKSI